LEKIAQVTGKLPQALQERPEPNIHMEQYIQAFLTLDYFRNELGRLNFIDIVEYSKVIGESEILEFSSIIVAIDRAFLKASREDKKIGN